MKTLGANMASWVSEGQFRAQVNVFRRFLWFITCVDMELLARCPASEQKKYASLGAAMLVSTLLAFVSGYITIDYIFPELGESGLLSALWKQVIAVALALFWTMIIFNLQRFIITGSSRDSDTDSAGVAELLHALPALVVSLTVGIAIALPLEIALFKPEIDLYLSFRSDQERMAREEKIDLSAYQSLLRSCSEHYRLQLAQKQSLQPCLQTPPAPTGETPAAADTPTASDGMGKASAPTPAVTPAAASDRAADGQATDVQASDVQAQTSDLRASVDEVLQSVEARKQHERELLSLGGGLIFRIASMFEATPYFATSVLLIVMFVQLTPVLIKIMAPKSPYDYVAEIWNRVVLANGGISKMPVLEHGGIEPRALAVYGPDGVARPVAIYHRAEQVAVLAQQRIAQEKEALAELRLKDAQARMRRLEQLSRQG